VDVPVPSPATAGRRGTAAPRGAGRARRALGLAFGAAAASALLYATVVGPWQRRWGATPEEVARQMPGDDLVDDPIEVTTRAITVEAPPDAIWPWLVQMGNNRGGLYSYDWIDLLIRALDRPSVEEVLPAFQHPRVGDVMPYARGSDFVFRVLEPGRHMVVQLRTGGSNVVQSWGLYPTDGRRTRLVLRVRAAVSATPWLVPALLVLDVSEGFMVRRQLLGIKARAEALAADRPSHADVGIEGAGGRSEPAAA
jgi:hypothetical protein